MHRVRASAWWKSRIQWIVGRAVAVFGHDEVLHAFSAEC